MPTSTIRVSLRPSMPLCPTTGERTCTSSRHAASLKALAGYVYVLLQLASAQATLEFKASLLLHAQKVCPSDPGAICRATMELGEVSHFGLLFLATEPGWELSAGKMVYYICTLLGEHGGSQGTRVFLQQLFVAYS